jgi:Phage integrase, N-terminal SAM-like domain
VAEELQRRRGLALEPHKLTVNQYLDRWLVHIQTTRRARTVARYRTLLAHHVRPYIGAQLLTGLEPLQVQGIYDQLGVGGRKDGKPGGLDPQHILAVHRCLHRALEQALTWRLLSDNPARHATPPPVPTRTSPRCSPSRSTCCWTPPPATPSRSCGPGPCWPPPPAPATASCAAWNGPTSTLTRVRCGSVKS